MKRRPYLIAFALFLACLLYDAIVWGALPALPEVGASIVDSAHREAPLASLYIVLGRTIDDAVPGLQAFGARRLSEAFGDGFARIREDATVAIDLIFNTTWNNEHRWIKALYWAPPFFLLLAAIFWIFRQKPLRVLKRR